MASTSNAENLEKIARIVDQLCDYADFRADFLKTRICRKWSVFANQVTYYVHLRRYYVNVFMQMLAKLTHSHKHGSHINNQLCGKLTNRLQ